MKTFPNPRLLFVLGLMLALTGVSRAQPSASCSVAYDTLYHHIYDYGYYTYEDYDTQVIYGHGDDGNGIPWTEQTRWTPYGADVRGNHYFPDNPTSVDETDYF